MSIRLFTFGLPRVEISGEELDSFQRNKLRCALLSFVAVERMVSRDKVIATFWPDRPTRAARHTLSQVLYEIRQELGHDVLLMEGERVRTSDLIWADCVAFEDAVEADASEEACTLYRGTFLDAADLWGTVEWQQWVDGQRARFAGKHRTARRQLMRELDVPDRVSEALAAARAWAELEPLDDEAHHAVIDLLARSGQRTLALTHFSEFAERLRSMLDVEPIDQTRDLVARIRSGEYGSQQTAPSPLVTWSEQDRDSTDTHTRRIATTTETIPDPVAAELRPHIELLRLLGKGSVATVYLAREVALHRLVAIKVLAEDLAREDVAVRRFQREAESAARIHHPNVLAVYSVGSTRSGRPYIAMPYVKGGSLEDRLKAWGPLEMKEAIRVISEVAAGLMAAHRMGIVHRDVRAANVLYDQETGRSLLCDFGLVAVLDELSAASFRLTKTGEWVGNPACISPEQLLGQPVTDRSDVYGLGNLAFELITGRGPFDAKTRAEFTIAHVRTKPHAVGHFRADVPDPLAELIEQCLAKKPEHRPALHEVIAVVDC